MITLIRRATIQDLPSMEPLAVGFWQASRFLGEFNITRFCSVWVELLNSGNAVIFMAEANGAPIGVLGGITHRDIYGNSLISEEMFWFVQSEYRGVGIRLYREFEAWAVEMGATRMHMVHMLDSMPDKVGKFYLHEGYLPVETRYVKELTA